MIFFSTTVNDDTIWNKANIENWWGPVIAHAEAISKLPLSDQDLPCWNSEKSVLSVPRPLGSLA